MGGVGAALVELKVVGRGVDAQDHAIPFRAVEEAVALERRPLPGRADIGPDESALLDGGPRGLAHLDAHRGVAVGRFQDRAVDRELPAVQQATDAAVLHPAERERSPAVNAEFVDHADPAARIAEHDEVLAEELGAERIAIGARQLARRGDGQPVAPHRAAHRRIRPDPGQDFVFFRAQHRPSPPSIVRAVRIIARFPRGARRGRRVPRSGKRGRGARRRNADRPGSRSPADPASRGDPRRRGRSGAPARARRARRGSTGTPCPRRPRPRRERLRAPRRRPTGLRCRGLSSPGRPPDPRFPAAGRRAAAARRSGVRRGWRRTSRRARAKRRARHRRGGERPSAPEASSTCRGSARSHPR